MKQLNKLKYVDLHSQLEAAREKLAQIQVKLKTGHNSTELLTQEAEYRATYVDIITPILGPIMQQCKANWIRYGGGYTKLNTV